MGAIVEVEENLNYRFEEDILLATIISESYLKVLRSIFKPEYITNSLIRDAIKWCINYFEKYGKSPKSDIKQFLDIGIVKGKLSIEDENLLKKLLSRLSREIEHVSSFNTQNYINHTKHYFGRRDLEIRISEANYLLQKDDIERANIILKENKNITELSGRASKIFTTNIIDATLSEEALQSVLVLPGELGRLFGAIRRGWLVAFLAPPKVGKSTALLELVFLAVNNFKKVLYINLEMDEITCNLRFYRRFLGLPTPADFYDKDVYPVIVPQFDCLHNQSGACFHSGREGGASIADSIERKIPYKPCKYCFVNKDDQWDEEPPIITSFPVKQNFSLSDFVGNYNDLKDGIRKYKEKYKHKLQSITRHLTTYLRVATYPSFVATIDDIRAEIELLDLEEGFKPDIIIIDYADILFNKTNDRHGLDKIWKEMKALSGEMSSLVVSASQTNRPALNKILRGQEDVAEEFKKMGHVDMFIGLSQLPFEKEHGLMRWNTVAHRHRDCVPTKQVYVTTCNSLNIGLLDTVLCNKATLKRVATKMREIDNLNRRK